MQILGLTELAGELGREDQKFTFETSVSGMISAIQLCLWSAIINTKKYSPGLPKSATKLKWKQLKQGKSRNNPIHF